MNHKPNCVSRLAVFLGAFCLSLSSVTAPQLDSTNANGVLEKAFTSEQKGFDIFVCGLDGKTMTFEVTPGQTVTTLKEQIAQKSGVCVHDQHLSIFGKPLKDCCKLQDYNIHPNASFDLSAKLCGGGKMTVNVVLPCEPKPKEMEIDTSETFPQVSTRIETLFERRGGGVCSIDHMTFRMNGSTSGTVGDNLGIYPGATLVVSLKGCNGGGFPFSTMEDTKIVKFTSDAPKWRRLSPGLNLEGTCANTSCEAHEKRVWAQKGFVRGLDLGREKSHCPICSERLKKVSNSGFYKCHYQVNGELAGGNEEEVERSGTDHGDGGFTTFNESTTGYKWITITTTRL